MILVPGVAMTVAIRDMISGELVSGVARGAGGDYYCCGSGSGSSIYFRFRRILAWQLVGKV